MKANEAPEKLYLQPSAIEQLPHQNIVYIKPLADNSIEYIRADAFIEKACRGIEKLLSGYIIRNFNFGDSYDVDRLIEDFVNYMKGEK